MKKSNIIIISLLFILSCTQWNVLSLQMHQYAFIPNGDKAGQVAIKTDEGGLEELSLLVDIFNDRIIVADNELKRIQVMDNDSDVELVIGDLDGINKEEVNSENFKFNIIGSFAMDNDGNLYVQNRLSKQTAQRGRNYGSGIDFTPSYILVFNENGELQHTLGQKGTPDIPFYHIETLEVDSNGRLFVISHSFDSWSVFQFTGKKRDFYANLGKIKFSEKEGKNEYTGKIESVKMYRSGEKFIISVAYYHNLRLKYRKLYDYSIEKDKLIEKELMNIPDPRNVLFDIVNDNRIYFWNIEEKDVRFMICNLDGAIVKNIKLNVDYKNLLYSSVISDGAGAIYSYNINKKGIEILQWE